MKPSSQTIVILAAGVAFLSVGIWWLYLPGMYNGAIVLLFAGAAFIIGGLIKLRKSPRR